MAVLLWLWAIVKSVLNGIAKAVVFVLVIVLVLTVFSLVSGDGLPGNMVLSLDLRDGMQDKAPTALIDIANPQISVMDVVLGLEAAGRDARVKGVALRVGSGDLSIAQAEELRDALKRFKTTGKFVYAHSQSFYSGGLGDYEVAAAADQIWMQPASAFFATGTSSATLFFKGLFDKLDAVPQFVQRYEYKNAANVFTEKDYTPAHREATGRVLQSWYESATAEVAADRKLQRDALIAFLDQSPATVEEAKAQGLVNTIGYDDEFETAARRKAGAGAQLTSFSQYVQKSRQVRPRTGGPVIAFVHAAGDIVEGDDKGAFGGATVRVAGDTFAQAIRDAAGRRDVRAILVRVDSPGGSAIASDQILNALKKARAAGKPIVVSMGSVAASGGYYISLAADRIVAEPGTLTGSIGVLWGKLAVGKSLELAGLEGRELGVGKNALFLSGLAPWTPEQLAEVNTQADVIYGDFTRKVAEGRKLPLDRVQEIARGRVWTGADAKERGLVDELGGFWTAVADAKRLAGIDPATRVVLRDYPQRRGFLETLSNLVDSSSATLHAVYGLDALMRSAPVQALLSTVQAADGQAQLRAVGLPGR